MRQYWIILTITVVIQVLALIPGVLPHTGFFEWGLYLIAVPLAYSIVALFWKTEKNKLKRIAIAIGGGVVLSILLSRHFPPDYTLQKILMVVLSVGFIYWVERK
jgi:hypothetical protein